MAVDADAPTSGLHTVPATMDLPQNGSEQDPGRRLEIVVSAAAQVHGGFRRGRVTRWGTRETWQPEMRSPR
jgi:hypothetical protein